MVFLVFWCSCLDSASDGNVFGGIVSFVGGKVVALLVVDIGGVDSADIGTMDSIVVDANVLVLVMLLVLLVFVLLDRLYCWC